MLKKWSWLIYIVVSIIASYIGFWCYLLGQDDGIKYFTAFGAGWIVSTSFIIIDKLVNKNK